MSLFTEINSQDGHIFKKKKWYKWNSLRTWSAQEPVITAVCYTSENRASKVPLYLLQVVGVSQTRLSIRKGQPPKMLTFLRRQLFLHQQHDEVCVCVCVFKGAPACMFVCTHTHTHTFVSKLTLHMLLRTHIHVKSVCVCVCFLRCVSRKGAVRRDDWRHFNTHTHTHNHTCYRTHTHTHTDTGWQVKAVTVKTEKSFS